MEEIEKILLKGRRNGRYELDIFGSLNDYIKFFPLAAFIALLLAGCNIPISEDLIIIAGAMISRSNPELLVLNLLCIYAGILISDVISYLLRKGLLKGARAAKMVRKAVSRLDKIRALFDRFGLLTFIVCRFIPFGVRNTLFISCGFTGLPLKKFLLFDVPASIISMNTLFFLVYRFGDIIEKPFRAAGEYLFIILLAVIVAGVIVMLVRRSADKVEKGEQKE